MTLALRTPQEAYHRVDFNARVCCADPAELVHLCFEHLVGALGTAIEAERRRDNSLKSRSMTRALTAVTALQLGVSAGEGVGAALSHLYEGARRAILDSSIAFDAPRLSALRTDFAEIALVLRKG